MGENPFIGYVGDRDFHDGSVLAVECEGDSVRVRVSGYSGKTFLVEFFGVRNLKSNKPEGMWLYSLSEMRGEPPFRRFVFVNAEDHDEALLELEAESFCVSEAVA